MTVPKFILVFLGSLGETGGPANPRQKVPQFHDRHPLQGVHGGPQFRWDVSVLWNIWEYDLKGCVQKACQPKAKTVVLQRRFIYVYLTFEEGQGYDNITGITYSSLNVLTAKVRSVRPWRSRFNLVSQCLTTFQTWWSYFPTLEGDIPHRCDTWGPIALLESPHLVLIWFCMSLGWCQGHSIGERHGNRAIWT